MNLTTFFLQALLLTLTVEIAAVFLLARFYLKFSSPKLIPATLLASFTTLPYLWFILPYFLQPYWLYALISEILVTILETGIFKLILNLNLKKCFTLSLLANFASFFLGQLIF